MKNKTTLVYKTEA